jgi:hypothetical protein
MARRDVALGVLHLGPCAGHELEAHEVVYDDRQEGQAGVKVGSRLGRDRSLATPCTLAKTKAPMPRMTMMST